MNIKRFFVFTSAIFFTIFCYEFLVHSVLLSSLYHQTAHLWRPIEEGGMYYHFMLLSQISFACAIYFMYERVSAFKEGLSASYFGFYIGLILGSVQIETYMYLPIPLILAGGWVVAAIGKGMVAGLVIDILRQKTTT